MRTQGNSVVRLVVVSAFVLAGWAIGRAPDASRLGPRPSAELRCVASAATSKVAFERNDGQWGHEVAFARRGPDHVTFLSGSSFTTTMVVGRDERGPRVASHRVSVEGAAADATPVGERRRDGRASYLLGAEPSAWVRDVPTFGALRVRGVIPGVDLVHHGERGLHEYDFVVSPGARPERIQLRFEGVDALHVDGAGDLVVTDGGRELRHTRPVVYQDTPAGRRSVDARFRLLDGHRVAFEVAAHDERLPLVIDPALVFSTYLGSAGEETLHAIAVDDEDRAIVAGRSLSADYPTEAALDGTLTGDEDAVVSKLGVTGSGLVFSTYLGGSGDEEIRGVAVDTDGGIVLAGTTDSADFPTAGAAQATPGGLDDVFLTKLGAAGSSIVRSTFLGGSSTEAARSVALGSDGSVHVIGWTSSADLPTTPGVVHPNTLGSSDLFAAKLAPAGTSFEYVTYVGGNSDEVFDGRAGVMVDADGRAVVCGITKSTNLPTVLGTLYHSFRGGISDAFVGRLAADGAAWDWITYIGGSGWEEQVLIAPGPFGNVWVGLNTTSTNLLTFMPVQGNNAGSFDFYLMNLDSRGNAVLSATYLGGAQPEQLFGLAADPTSGVWLAGSVQSAEFPTLEPLDATLSGGSDFALVKFDRLGRALELSTFFGGSGNEGGNSRGNALAVSASGEVFLTGATQSTDFPTAGPPFQSERSGGFFEPIVARFGTPPPVPVVDDGGLHATKASFKINRTKHARGVAADTLALKATFNPRGVDQALDGAIVTLEAGGVELFSTQLDARGKARSARGDTPKLKVVVKGERGQIAIKAGSLDLREAFGVPDATSAGPQRVDISVTIQGAGLATETVGGALEFAAKSKAGKTAKGKFKFAKQRSVDGTIRPLRTTATESGDGRHVLDVIGVLAVPDAETVNVVGDVRIQVGNAPAITVSHEALRVTGTGSRTTTTLERGAVAELSRLELGGRKLAFRLTTTELSGVGLPAAGEQALTTVPIQLAIEIDAASGPVRFETTVELRRAAPTSTRWLR
jgi:hypothetical protein